MANAIACATPALRPSGGDLARGRSSCKRRANGFGFTKRKNRGAVLLRRGMPKTACSVEVIRLSRFSHEMTRIVAV